MKILVTGGAGYIGSLLVPRLLDDGHEVTVLDRLLWGAQPLFSIAGHKNFNLVIGDLRDQKLVKKLVSQNEAIINLAAIVGFPACQANPEEAIKVNLESVNNLSNMVSDQILIQASTGSTYGSVDGICTEDTPINPLTLYGETKAKSEENVLAVDGICLRFATVFGLSPRMRLDLLVNDIANQAVKNGTFVMYQGDARRTFLHSTDAANSILFSLRNYDAMKCQAFNVGDESLNYTKREVAFMIKEFHDFYIHEADVGEDKDKRDYEVSYQKIKKLGYKANISMKEGIQELIKVMPMMAEASLYKNFN